MYPAMAATITENEWREMITKIKELEARVAKEKEPCVGYLTNKKSFGEVPKYCGKAELYDPWRFKFCNFLYEENGWIEVMRRLDLMLTMPTDADLDVMKSEIKQLQLAGVTTEQELVMKSSQLYLCLCSKLDGASLTSIRNLEAHDVHCGWKAWLKVAHECTHMSSQRAQSLVVRIHQPKRVKKYADVNPAIDEWENLLKQYELHEKTSLADAMKVFALRQIVPEELDRDIYKNNSLTDYPTTKSYVQTQVNIRRDLPAKSNGVVPMDCDAAYLADVKARTAMLANLGWGSCQHAEEKNQGHDHHHQDGRDAPDTKYEEEMTDEAKSINALFELVKDGGETAVHAAQALSMMKGGKGKSKGKGKSWGDNSGESFQGNCSHCGKWGHMKKNCRFLDKEMEQWRASNGKSQGKGFQHPGKGWGHQGKGHNSWNNFGKGGKSGSGKGGANYMGSNEWANSSAATSWASSLQKMAPGHDAQGFTPASRTTTGKLISTLNAPPGLHLNYFGALENIDDEENVDKLMEEDKIEYKKQYPDSKNYSKGSVRRMINELEKKPQHKKVKRVYKPAKEVCMLEKQPVQKEINAFAAATPDSDGYIKITGVMDSGASESVAPPTMCPQFDIKPSPGSIIGQNYLSASNGVMYNVGEQILEVVTSTGKESAVKYQMVDQVTRPLNSISEICDAGGLKGQHVIFGRSGGVILNLDTGDQTPFSRTDGIYTMDMWVKPKAGFARRD